MSIEVRTLGPLEVWRDGRRLALGAAKHREVLAVLLVRRAEVGSDVLVDALWGEAPPKGARNTLQVYVSRLRKVLGDEVILTTPVGYRIHLGADSLDAERFERLFRDGRERLVSGDAAGAFELLADALALWRGPALSDFGYEPFAQAEAGRLEELRLACLEERVEAELQLGRHAEVVGELEALILEHPLRERLRGELILALYRCGRQSEALTQYQATRRMLADELGLEPSEELRKLQRMILAHDPTLAAPPPPANKPPSNLQAQATPFIGREQELAELVKLIRSGKRRLVTLTGPGGSGKTRLAIEAADQLLDEYPDGVFWVPLQSLADSRLVLPTMAAAIGAKGPVERFVHEKRMLILVDNFEHLIDAAAPIAALLAGCPNLVLLVTSREALHVAAERKVLVPPMAEADAVTLFEERAEQEAPSETIAQICRRLDCLPLAVELAAARTSSFSPEQLLERLAERLPLLTGGPRDAPARQQTLRATLEWSYDLLSADEQRLFARLSVFAGGCTLEAAEEVCEATLEGLEALTDKSLLVHRGGRYAMLETIREFAQERLEAMGEAEDVKTVHAGWLLQLSERAFAETRPLQSLSLEVAQQWTAALEAEVDNLRAALRWFIDHEQKEAAVRLVFGFHSIFGGKSGRDAEGYLREALAAKGEVSEATRGRALFLLGGTLTLADKADEAEPLLQEALQLVRADGDARGTVLTLRMLGMAAESAAELDRSRLLFEEALAADVESPDLRNMLLINLGNVELDMGDLGRARALLEDAHLRSREGGQYLNGTWARYGLAEIDRIEGLFDDADEGFRECLRLASSGGWYRAIWPSLGGLAVVALQRRDLRRSGRLWGGTLQSLHEHGTKLLPVARRRYKPILDGRSEPEYLQALEEGRTLSLGEVVAEALGDEIGAA